MHMQTVRTIAKRMEIRPMKARKQELIHSIQKAEGNFPCFGTAINGICDQQDCLWREDCLKSNS